MLNPYQPVVLQWHVTCFVCFCFCYLCSFTFVVNRDYQNSRCRLALRRYVTNQSITEHITQLSQLADARAPAISPSIKGTIHPHYWRHSVRRCLNVVNYTTCITRCRDGDDAPACRSLVASCECDRRRMLPTEEGQWTAVWVGCYVMRKLIFAMSRQWPAVRGET